MASGKSKSAKEVTSVFGTLVRVAEPEDIGGPTCVRVKTVKKSGKEEDVQEENGVLFWVNKSGFPIDDKTWDRMWDHVARIHPDGYDVIHKVRDKKDLPSVSKIMPVACTYSVQIHKTHDLFIVNKISLDRNDVNSTMFFSWKLYNMFVVN